MLDVKFKAHDGRCPYFRYRDTLYYIQDREENGSPQYSLMAWRLFEKVEIFEEESQAVKWVEDQTAKQRTKWDEGNGWMLCQTSTRLYVIKSNEVTVKETPTPLTGEFDSYLDCLKVAKKRVQEIIEKTEPKQISLEV